MVAVAVANRLTTGGFWFAYEHPGVHTFWPSHLLTTAPSHLLTVVLMPPLLITGAAPFLQRRELGPLAVIVGFGALMCVYFFVDTGTTWIETRILAPRLLLPVVVFLLIGYADLLARLARRITGHVTAVRVLLTAVALTVTLAISARHSRWQQAAGQALAAAERIARDRGVGELRRHARGRQDRRHVRRPRQPGGPRPPDAGGSVVQQPGGVASGAIACGIAVVRRARLPRRLSGR